MKNVLVIAGGGIGDVLMATPVFRALARSVSGLRLTVMVVTGVNRQVLEPDPNVNEILVWREHEKDKLKLIQHIRKQKFDIAIHTHGSTRIYFHLLPFLAGIPVRVGFDRRPLGEGILGWLKLKMLTSSVIYRPQQRKRTEMNLEVLSHCGIDNSDVDYELHFTDLSQRDSSRVGIHPGSDGKGVIKRWPIGHFMTLATQLNSEFGKKVVFYIGPAERELKKGISTNANIEIVEAASIGQLVKDMSRCGYFISNDSGLSHVAAALKIPTVVLFGPTSPEEYELPSKHVNVQVQGYDCTRCFKEKRCEVASPTCMKTLEVERVLGSFNQLLEKMEAK